MSDVFPLKPKGIFKTRTVAMPARLYVWYTNMDVWAALPTCYVHTRYIRSETFRVWVNNFESQRKGR